jgi:hypothetical protein
MTTRNKWLGMCILAVIVLAVMALLPQTACAQNASLEDIGNGLDIYSRYYDNNISSYVFKMNVSGTIYDGYCIDLYTSIDLEDNLTVNGSLAEDTRDIDWCAVNYILNTYTGSSNSEAAAIQAAIWYYCSEEYGDYADPAQKYQFMTDPNETKWYDGQLPNESSIVRDRAFEMINSVPRNISGDCTFKFPTTIDLTPEKNLVNGSESITITATLYDQNSDPLPGITVKFNVTEGNGTINPDSGTTDGDGQVQVTFTAYDPPDNSTVVAWPEGDYGTLLRGDHFVIPKQNVTTVTLIPRSIEDSTILAPIPELPTIVLTGTGLLTLVGYVMYGRRRGKQQ